MSATELVFISHSVVLTVAPSLQSTELRWQSSRHLPEVTALVAVC